MANSIRQMMQQQQFAQPQPQLPQTYQIPQQPQQPQFQMSQAQQPMQNNPMGMLNQIRQFASSIKDNPQQMVMRMIQSGQRTNADLQQAMQMARQITGTGMFK